MKQRIIATILLLVTVLTMLASCVNYAFAEDNMDYVELNLGKLMEALHNIEIEEEDFGPDENRKEIVVEEIYNTILTALNKDTDNEKTDFANIGEKDMVKYYYYCSVVLNGKTYTFNYNMKTAVSTPTSTSTDDSKELQKEIVKEIVSAVAGGRTFNKDTDYEIKTTLNNEKITKYEDGTHDRIVVSYTLKTTEGGKTTYVDYANLEITPEHDIYKDILDNKDAVVSSLGSYKANEGVVVGDKHYLNIKISHIIKNDGTSVDVEWENKEELTQVVYNADMAQETVVIPESTDDAKVNITYHVYPVSYVQAPTVEAREVIKYVLGDDITTDSLPVFTENADVKTLVESLIEEYAKTAKDYESDEEITKAKGELDVERDLAKQQAIRDKIDALKKVEKYEDLEAAILAHTGKADIYEVFASKVKLSDLLPLGILGLYTYKNTSGATAVTLVNAINAEHDKDVNTAYDSYTKTKSTLPDHKDKKIDVADKKERYEDLVDKAQTAAVEAIIDQILAVKGVATLIVDQYNESDYKTDFLAYDIVKYIILNDTKIDASSFIEDLSDYVYGTSTLDDEERETFSTILAALKAEFAKADADFDTVSSVKGFKDKVEEATKAYDEAQGKTETSTTATKSISRYATLLKTYKIDANKDNKADEKVDTNADGKVDDKDDDVKTAFDALVEKYIVLHPETVYVVGTANDGEKSITNSTYAAEALQLIIDDVDHVADYRAVLEKDSYLNSSNENGALAEFNNAIDLDAKSDAVKEATEALNDARKAAKEAAVDNLIAKLLSGVLGEEKLSVVLPERYVEDTLNTKINKYNTNVKNKLAKAVYEIINNQVVINTEHASYQEQYPWDLVEEFEKTLKESYKSAFYTGTSDKTAAGTYGPAVSAEDIANYEKFTAQYKEANEAITSANAGVDAAVPAYIAALLTIYKVEAGLGTEAGASYFNENNTLTTLAKAYNDAKKAYDDANAANNVAKSELKKAQTALAEAESAFETVKDEGFTIFHKEWWNARAEVKAAEKTVKEKTEAVEGTKKVDGTADVLGKATTARNTAKDNLVKAFSTAGVAEEFVATQKEFNTKKSTYNTAVNTSSTENNLDKKLEKLASAKKAVADAGEATDAQKKTLEDAEKAVKSVLDAATAYADSALAYYADSKAVEAAAKGDYDAAVAALEDTKDEDGNVTKEGLKTKIAKAEEFEKGEALTNVEVYGHLDAYLEHVLGYNWEAVIREQAVEQVNEQIKIYAVAKALKDVAANGYVNADLGINVQGYKAAIEAIEAEDGRITKVLEHSIKHNDEDIKDKKLQKETKEAYEKLLEATDSVFVDKKVFNEYKKELGRSNYKYAKDQYGENNLRMYLQIDNLLTYLLYTDIQENEYAMHDGEYTVREIVDENGNAKLAYLFINYEFKAED